MDPARAGAASRRYRIERYLTEGGMGAIYIGKKLGAGGFEKEVVLKQLLSEFTHRPEFRDLFFREAKISASLDHVNIVRTYDLVRSDDALFIVMEYVPGTDLRTITWRARTRRRPLTVAAILHIGMEVLAGLEYAHTRTHKGQPLGIIHRDVSPSNILCSGQGDVKLSDFGIAKAHAFASVFYRVRGKVGYMSPEQARNQPLDGRSDVFSAAVCLVETIIGERLFVGDLQTPPEQVYGRPMPDLRRVRPDIPLELQAIFARALTLQPEDRFATAGDFALALRAVAERHGMLYSARQLADELRALLGPNPETWRKEYMTEDTERLPIAGRAPGVPVGVLPSAPVHVGHDAESVEIEIGHTHEVDSRAGTSHAETVTLPPLERAVARPSMRAPEVAAGPAAAGSAPAPASLMPSGTLETLAISSASFPALRAQANAARRPAWSRGRLFWLLLFAVAGAFLTCVAWCGGLR